MAAATSARRVRWQDVVGTVARMVLGVVLIVAGVLKVPALEYSVTSVHAYQLLPYDMSRFVGYVLPFAEIIVGLMLVSGLATRVAAILAGLMMVVFIVGIASAWARGLSIDCGCFGGGGVIAPGETRYPEEILRDLGLLALAAWLVVRPRTAWSLDGFLRRTPEVPPSDD